MSQIRGNQISGSVATASYIDPTFISASAAAAGFGTGGGGGTGAGFPFSGNAIISGSLLVTGSGLNVSGSTRLAGPVGVTGSVVLGPAAATWNYLVTTTGGANSFRYPILNAYGITGTSEPSIGLHTETTDIIGSRLYFFRSRANSALTTPGFDLGELQFWGAYNSTPAYVQGASIKVTTTHPTIQTSSPAKITFSTTPSGSITPVERMVLDETGSLRLNKPLYLNSDVSVAGNPKYAFANSQSLNTGMFYYEPDKMIFDAGGQNILKLFPTSIDINTTTRFGSQYHSSIEYTSTTAGAGDNMILKAGINTATSRTGSVYVSQGNLVLGPTTFQSGSRLNVSGSSIFIGSMVVTGSFTQSGSATFTGNVGIGNTSPTTTLHVGTSTSFMKVTPRWLSNAGTWIDLSEDGPSGIGTGGPGVNPWLAYVSFNGAWFTDALVGDLAYRNVEGKLLFGSDPAKAAVAISGGRLGIGTVDPTHRLYVVGDDPTIARFEGPAGNSINIVTSDETLTAGYAAPQGSIGSPGNRLQIKYGSANTQWANATYDLYEEVNLLGQDYPIDYPGVYNVTDTDLSHNITFPNPGFKDESGNKIVIINSTDLYIDLVGTIYIEGSGQSVNTQSPRTIAEYISTTTGWQRMATTKQLTYSGIDITDTDYIIYTKGVYQFTVTTDNTGISFPDPANHSGETITIINNGGSNIAPISTNAPKDQTNSVMDGLATSVTYQFTAIGNSWRLVSRVS